MEGFVEVGSTKRAYGSLLLLSTEFYLGFLVWGEELEGDGGRVHSHRLQFSRGVWGHAPFEILSLLRVVLSSSVKLILATYMLGNSWISQLVTCHSGFPLRHRDLCIYLICLS